MSPSFTWKRYSLTSPGRGPLPDRPLAIWGWGRIPDQYGRRGLDTDDDGDE